MKTLYLAASLLALLLPPCGASALSSIPDPIYFGDTFICVNADHSVVFYSQAEPRKLEIAIDLPHKQTLHFVMLDDTNIVRSERYLDAWIVLLETSQRVKTSGFPKFDCETAYGAVIVRDDPRNGS
jgi:hypothetical protein